jgi:hypothetical protein
MQIFDHPDQSIEGRGQSLPFVLLIVGAGLAVLRYYVFHVIHAHQSHDAQWQLDYWPLWVLDLPISIAYFLTPIPFGEAIVGTIWWFALPIVLWKLSRKRKPAA